MVADCAGPSLDQLARGLPNIGNILSRMMPPDLSRIDRILAALFQTFQMAVAGCAIGLILSVPLGILAADGLSPHPAVRSATRSLIAIFRTVPDLVWALIFVIAVGLGSPAGVLAIAIDVMGFAGRFFAEAMEETDKGPREALSAVGASRTGLIMAAVLPLALPSMIATSLYCLEKATRASVVLVSSAQEASASSSRLPLTFSPTRPPRRSSSSFLPSSSPSSDWAAG